MNDTVVRPHEPESAGCLARVAYVGDPLRARSWLCPWLVNRPGVMAAFLQEFEERTGHRLSIEESAVHFPTPGLTLTGPRLYDSPSTVPWCSRSG